MWTGVSIILLLAGIGLMASDHASIREPQPLPAAPVDDPPLNSTATPSQRAIVKYFWIVAALILVQILLGVITAHYGVEGNGFYGIALAEYLPYSVASTFSSARCCSWSSARWRASG